MAALVFCPDCRHCRPPRPVHGRMRYRGLSPGLAQAAMEELRMREELRAIEWQRADAGDRLDRPPQFQPFCGKHTLDDEDLARVEAALRSGDLDTQQNYRDLQFDWTVDLANGQVRRVYDLCQRRNDGACPDFEPLE
jgi:hypothetical protein